LVYITTQNERNIMSINKGLFSSATPEWETPQELFDGLNEKHHFNLDPASTDQNAKCENHFTKLDDGLSKNWGGQSVWLNPPYGREIGKWVRKAYEESLKPGTTVVCLLPARTDTAWFHDYCAKGDVEFIRGRLKFGGSKQNAPFPSMIVTFESSRADHGSV
jgi:site-specific DNA-methyltransferase (adenine-specific)